MFGKSTMKNKQNIYADTIKTQISNLDSTTRFWNNFYQGRP